MTFDWIPGRTALVLCAAVAIAACGGGGGGGGGNGNGASAAFTDASVGAGDDPKELAFAWSVDGDPAAFRLEANPDGASGFTPVDVNGDGTVDANDELAGSQSALDLPIPLHRTDFVNALYQVVALDSGGSELERSDELSIMGIVVEELIGYFKASNTDNNDRFGWSIAVSGDGATIAVGAKGESSSATGVDGNQTIDSAGDAGAVYVFNRDAAGIWTQQAYVKASNTDAGDEFGGSVALSGDGDTLAVGAMRERSAATGVFQPERAMDDDTFFNTGAVYVFVRDGPGTWSQQAYVKPSNTDGGERFGRSVALSGDGDSLAVGAFCESSNATGINGDQTNNDAACSGATYVFVRDAGGVWTQQAYVKASNTEDFDFFGTSVALSSDGDTLAIGAHEEDSAAEGVGGIQADDCGAAMAANCAEDSGAVYVFHDDGSGWAQTAYVKASNTGAFDRFGRSIALSGSGDTLAVGAANEDSDSSGVNGPDNDTGISNVGAAYVFTRDVSSGSWSHQAYIKASNPSDGYFFGVDVALSDDGDTLTVGASQESSDQTGVITGGPDAAATNDDADHAGAAYAFVDDGTGWAQVAYVKASNTGAFDGFGFAVALSGTGDTLIVGARGEESAATGIGGDQIDNNADGAGAAYLY